jgi:hypothetical protein
MIRGILFRQALEKFLKSPVAQNARVQVCLPNGEFYDIKEIKLLENKLIGVRETHRLVLTIEPEKWRMGQVVEKRYRLFKCSIKNYKGIYKNV